MAPRDPATPGDTGTEDSLAFCNGFLSILRLVRLYDTDNVAYTDPLETMKALTARLVSRFGAARVQAEEGMIYFNKEPLRGGRKAFGTIQNLSKAMAGMGVAEMVFSGAVAVDDLKLFCNMLKEALPQEQEAVRSLQQQLEGNGLKARIWVMAEGETTGKAIIQKVEIDEEQYFPLAYAKTLVLLREYVKNLRNEELSRYFSQKLHRSLQEIVGLVPKYFNRWLSLAAIRGKDEYLFCHMQSTGLLSMLLGHKIGLSKVKMTDLGLSAMLHGLGRFRTAPHLVDQANLDEEERSELGKHAYRAMGALLEGRKITGKMLACATVGFQYDLSSGYVPLRIPPANLHPYSHIVRVCSKYVELTSDLEDRPALLPDQALKELIEAPEGTYDPMVLTAFANMVGLYPTGTCVTLSQGEVAVVVHPNPEFPKRPLVAVVRGRDGSVVDGEYVDLADRDEAGHFQSHITGSIDPAELGVSIPEYLLG